MTTKLVAAVGMNVGEKRFEPGETVSADLTERQRRFLIEEGYALETENRARLDKDTKAALEGGAAEEAAHPVVDRIDTKEE